MRTYQTAMIMVSCVAMISGLLLVSSVLHPVAAQSNQQAPEPDKAAGDASARAEALRQQIVELEGKIVDLQVVVGTLASLSKQGKRSSGQVFTNGRVGADAGNSVAELEAQVTALNAHVARLNAEARALQTQGVTLPAPHATYANPLPPVAGNPDPAIGTGFGATTVSPADGGDAIGDLVRATELPSMPEPPIGAPPNDQLAATQPQPDFSAQPQQPDAAKEVYQQAYEMVLQQDYEGAQTAFRAFLREHPKHALVPNALYWLGETYYVQQNFTDAAEAFDIVTVAYGQSNKAPDSQLKRGMALANLGKRTEACSVLRALPERYPNAPDHVKSKADSERARVGCS